MKSELGHFPKIEQDSEGFSVYCICGWYGGNDYQTKQDALDAHEDHEAGEYAV